MPSSRSSVSVCVCVCVSESVCVHVHLYFCVCLIGAKKETGQIIARGLHGKTQLEDEGEHSSCLCACSTYFYYRVHDSA